MHWWILPLIGVLMVALVAPQFNSEIKQCQQDMGWSYDDCYDAVVGDRS